MNKSKSQIIQFLNEQFTYLNRTNEFLRKQNKTFNSLLNIFLDFNIDIGTLYSSIANNEHATEAKIAVAMRLHLVPPSKLYSVLADIVNVLPPDTPMLRPITYDNMYFYNSIIKVHGASKKGVLSAGCIIRHVQLLVQR